MRTVQWSNYFPEDGSMCIYTNVLRNKYLIILAIVINYIADTLIAK